MRSSRTLMVGPCRWAWLLDGGIVLGGVGDAVEKVDDSAVIGKACLIDAGLDDGEEFSVDRGFVVVVLKAGGGVGGADRAQRGGTAGGGVVGGPEEGAAAHPRDFP